MATAPSISSQRAPVALVTAMVLLWATACGDEAGSGGTAATGATNPSGTITSPSASGNATSTKSGNATGSVVGATSGGDPNAPKCAGSNFAICESFEDTADGAFPDGFGARGDEWGQGTIGVASDEAKRGNKSLKVDGGNDGQHFMDYKGNLGALASHHYGRVFMKVATPAPWPSDGVLHADFIEGLGPNSSGGQHNVRWGVVENTQNKFQWIFNVQPSNAGEWGDGTSYDYDWPGEWQCIEWYYDEPSQDGTLWIDGAEIPIDVGQSHAPEIPVFESLGVGLANYQPAGEGFTVWFDELAYDDERIGCDG